MFLLCSLSLNIFLLQKAKFAGKNDILSFFHFISGYFMLASTIATSIGYLTNAQNTPKKALFSLLSFSSTFSLHFVTSFPISRNLTEICFCFAVSVNIFLTDFIVTKINSLSAKSFLNGEDFIFAALSSLFFLFPIFLIIFHFFGYQLYNSVLASRNDLAVFESTVFLMHFVRFYILPKNKFAPKDVLVFAPFILWASTAIYSQKRLFLLTFWSILFLSMIKMAPQNRKAAPNSKKNFLKRKYFHFFVILFIAPALFADAIFLAFALYCAILSFVILEYIRRNHDFAFVAKVDSFYKRYKDDRDHDNIYLSHIYLLTGVSLPVFLQILHFGVPKTAFDFISALSGLTALGVLDAFAAISGILLKGKMRFENGKTVEGMLGGFLSALIFEILVYSALNSGLPDFSVLGKMVFPIISCSVFEAMSVQFDNLYIPIVLYSLNILFLVND
ncbi:hypothetical protein MHBO_001482 [Bonamia ostreae]|uniref:dolichol kinase n=1 Tax=Bonamia ostreae TaxID=126728 RepID=A0ABV2AJ35_9EUKA